MKILNIESFITKKCTTKLYCFLVTDTTLASNIHLCFRTNVLNLIMKIYGKIRDEKLKYDIDKEATKISVLSSSRIDKYEYLTGEKILTSNQS